MQGQPIKWCHSCGGSEQIFSMILYTTKAMVVESDKDKLGRMNKLGRMFRLYWMGIIPHIIGKRKKTLGQIKNLVGFRYVEVI